MRFAADCTGRHASGTLFRTNAFGLRDGPVADDGAPRILVVGDSCTFGWRVEEQDAYPQRLERLLAEREGARRYRVINAGVPGYTSYQGLAWLRAHGLALHPQIVVVAFWFNDALPQGDIEHALAWQRRLMPLLAVDDLAMRGSALWRWLRARLMPTPPPDTPPRVSPERYAHNLREMVRLTRAQGGQAMLVFFATPESNYWPAVSAVSRDEAVPMVVYEGPRIDLVHPTREGYRTLAETLRDRLTETGLVPPS
jgi:lysophospholipase L1-like esterase